MDNKQTNYQQKNLLKLPDSLLIAISPNLLLIYWCFLMNQDTLDFFTYLFSLFITQYPRFHCCSPDYSNFTSLFFILDFFRIDF